MRDSLVRGKVWPDGTFVLWRKSLGERSEPDLAVPIGLSRVANSHKNEPEIFERLQRGIRGITSHGQSMVKNAAYLMQQVHGGRRLSFLTCTLPGNPEETMRAGDQWAEIVRVFLQWLKRRLVRAKLSPAIVSVSEIQPKRFLRDGGMPLHLHIVFQGAHKDFAWEIGPDEFKRAWRRCVVGRVPTLAERSFASALNVQHVKTSASNYLGKYMSKGEEDISAVLDANPELAFCLPSTWYNLSSEAREAVKANMVVSEKAGLMLEKWTQWPLVGDYPFSYVTKIDVKGPEGELLKSFWTGEVKCHWKRLLGVPVSKYDIVGL